MWLIEKVPETSFVRNGNRWKPEQFLHIERGAIESGRIEPGWLSAMWTIQ